MTENEDEISTQTTLRQTNYSKVVLLRKGSRSYVQKKISISQANQLMTDIDSPYVVKYLDSKRQSQNKKLSIYMPYYPNGDLQDYLIQNPNLPFKQKMKMFVDILSGLAELHKKFIIHRDLKLRNIFVDWDGTCVIGDLGIAISTESVANTQIGTPAYQAPDVFSDDSQYNQKVDVWGLGIIAYQLFNQSKNGKLPYPFGNIEDFKTNVMQHRSIVYKKYIAFTNTILPFDSSVSFKLSYLIQKMLKNDSKQRISWIQLYSSDILFKLSGEDERLIALKAEYKCYEQTKQILRSYKTFINNFMQTYYDKLQKILYNKEYTSQNEQSIVQNNLLDFHIFFYLGMKRVLEKYKYIKSKNIYKTISQLKLQMSKVQITKNFIQDKINETLLRGQQISKNKKYLSQQQYERRRIKVTSLLKFKK